MLFELVHDMIVKEETIWVADLEVGISVKSIWQEEKGTSTQAEWRELVGSPRPKQDFILWEKVFCLG